VTQHTSPEAKVKTVEQQKTDFTAEGAPPPGVVGTPVPATHGESGHTASRSTIHVPADRKHPPQDKTPHAK